MNQRHHTTLASYFQSKPLYLDEPTQKKPNIRKLVELPWQQTKGELWYEVTNTLCDLDFIQAKAAARMTYDLVNDFNEVLEVIPDNQENIRKEKARQARMDKYTQDLIACAKGEITIDELEIPESITPWTDEQIDQEIERIKTNPTNTDKLKDFLNFLGNESSNLQNYANEFSYFSHQQAWNFNYEGSLGNAATKTSEKTLNKLILRNLSNRPFLVPLRQAIKSLKGHIGPVNTVAFTTDSRRALSGSHDNNCILWNLQNGQPLFILKGHTSSVDNLAITLDGKNAVSCSWKECIYWDLSTGRLLKNLKISNNGITAIAITFDGKRVIAGYSDNSCVIWDLSKELSLRTLTGHTGKINKIESTPDCKYALTESNNEIILWNLETGKTINIYKKDIDYKNRIRMSPNGKLIYLQIEYTSRNIYDEKNGECILSSKGHVGIVNCLEMTHDGKFAISASDDKTCIIWDIEKNIPIRTFVGHTESVNYVVLSPDGKLAISASTDGTCIIWNLENGKENNIERHLDSITDISISPNGEKAITASKDKFCKEWNINQFKLLNTFFYHSDLVNSVAYSSNGKLIISTSDDNTCILYNKEKLTYKSLYGHKDYVEQAVFTPDGRKVISRSADCLCVIWNTETEKLNNVFHEHKNIVDSITINPIGKYAISASRDNSCIVWDIESCKILKKLTIDNSWIKNIHFTPDGKMALMVYLENNNFILWDIWNDKHVKVFKGHRDAIITAFITSDGKHAVSSSKENVCIWRLKSGQIERNFRVDNNQWLRSITHEGNIAFSTVEPNSCSLYDLKKGIIVAKFVCNQNISSMCIHNNILILGGDSGDIFVVKIPSYYYKNINIITIRRIWDYEFLKYQEPSADCPSCGHRFNPRVSVIETINIITKKTGLSPDQSPCLELPDEAWEDSGLLGNCPSCGEKLKFNPFIAGGD